MHGVFGDVGRLRASFPSFMLYSICKAGRRLCRRTSVVLGSRKQSSRKPKLVFESADLAAGVMPCFHQRHQAKRRRRTRPDFLLSGLQRKTRNDIRDHHHIGNLGAASSAMIRSRIIIIGTCFFSRKDLQHDDENTPADCIRQKVSFFHLAVENIKRRRNGWCLRDSFGGDSAARSAIDRASPHTARPLAVHQLSRRVSLFDAARNRGGADHRQLFGSLQSLRSIIAWQQPAVQSAGDRHDGISGRESLQHRLMSSRTADHR